MNTSLVLPMLGLVLLTFVVLIVMFVRRIQAIRSGQVKMSYFKLYPSDAVLPEKMLQASDHFENLFEVPVLFYAACITAMVIQVQGNLILYAAWAYVVFRVLHAIVHLSSNRIRYRMRAYGLSWLSLLIMWGLIAAAVF